MSVTPFPRKDEELLPEEAAKILTETAATLSRVAASMVRSGTKETKVAPRETYLTAKEVAERLNVTTKWVYRHLHEIPGCERLSKRNIRIPKSGFLKFLAAKRS